MEGGDGTVAWLALVVGLASLVWQVVEAVRRRRRRIEVRVRHLAIPASVPNGPELLAFPAIGLDDEVIWPAMEPLSYAVAVVVINDGEATEYLEDIRIRNVAGTLGAGANAGRAEELRPRERFTWAFRPERAVFDLRDGFFVTAVFASGKPVETGPHFLRDGLREHIAGHNAELPRERPTEEPDP